MCGKYFSLTCAYIRYIYVKRTVIERRCSLFVYSYMPINGAIFFVYAKTIPYILGTMGTCEKLTVTYISLHRCCINKHRTQ